MRGLLTLASLGFGAYQLKKGNTLGAALSFGATLITMRDEARASSPPASSAPAFPSPAWCLYDPVPNDVGARAASLLPALWDLRTNTIRTPSRVERGARGEWVAYQAQWHGPKMGVNAWRLCKPAPAPAPDPSTKPPCGCSGGEVLSIAELRELAADVGFQGDAINIAAAIAMAESLGHVTCHGDCTLGDSYGLWQVNHKAHPQYDVAQLNSDAEYNAQCAFEISRGGTYWRPWTTYWTSDPKRSYRQYMP